MIVEPRVLSRRERKEAGLGTWGDGPFDADGASDWVWELQEGQVAWAAAAVVAASDDSSIRVPEEVTAWLDGHRHARPETICLLALQAVRRVLAANSELVELWQEAGNEDAWRANVEKVAVALA